MTPPPPTSDSASLSVEEAAEICSSHAQLMNLMSQLLEWVGSQPSTAPIASATALLGAAPQMGPFIPPIATVGSNVLAAIITHKFRAMDLHKLDPTNCDCETAYAFNGATNQFKVSHRAACEYKMPFSVLIPLQSYF
ncbi:hypothetical protein J132_07205 [Termitomyces sp. J132]|nr:hypothetical protein H2248_004263 [Termitomyces sp. 'cryptogamus']KNZ74347.1 hypothetical protein J132_07205 [Termitomyces sp. J132]